MSYFEYGAGSGGAPSSTVISLPVLSGLTNIVTHRIGQSNDTSHTQNAYGPTTYGGKWNGTSLVPTAEKNTLNYVFQKFEPEGKYFIYTKSAVGGSTLQDHSPGGPYHAAALAAEDLLWQEYGRIDLRIMFIGESNAGDNTSISAMRGYISDYIDGMARTATAILAIGPPNMGDIPDIQEQRIRDAYAAEAAARNNFFYAPLDTIMTDDDINNHHIDRESTADAASDLIKAVIEQMF